MSATRDILLWPAAPDAVPDGDLWEAMFAALEHESACAPEEDLRVAWAFRRGKDVCVQVEEA